MIFLWWFVQIRGTVIRGGSFLSTPLYIAYIDNFCSVRDNKKKRVYLMLESIS